MTPENKDKAGRFVKGVSGNPGGRPAVVRDFRQRCRDFMESGGWQKLIDLANTSGDKDQLRALELIASYAYGKPKQGVELTGEDGGPVAIANLSPDEVTRLYELYRKQHS